MDTLPSSKWRSTVALRSSLGSMSGLEVSTLEYDATFGYQATACVNSSHASIAVGCDIELALLEEKSEVKGLEITNRFTLPASLCAMDWSEGLLFLGTQEYIYSCYLNPNSKTGNNTVRIHMKYHHKSENVSGSYGIPGLVPFGKNVTKVKANIHEKKFFTLQNNILRVWDINNSQSCVSKHKLSHLILKSADWCQRNSNLICVGGFNCKLKMCDLRNENPIVSEYVNEKALAVMDVAWNPLIDHWVAASQSNGNILIFDLRSVAKPVLTFREHTTSVCSLSWNPAHCELLLSGSYDGSMKLWSLNEPPHHVVANFSDQFTDDVNSVFFLPSAFGKGAGMSSSGEICYFEMLSRFTEPLCPKRLPRDIPLGFDTELHMYQRDFSSAFEIVRNYVDRLGEEGDHAKALALINLCLHEEDEYISGTFQEQLKHYTYYPPPHLDKSHFTKPSKNTREKLKFFKIRSLLVNSIRTHDHARIVALRSSLTEIIEKNVDSLPMGLVLSALKVAVKHNYIGTITLAIGIGEALIKVYRFSDFAPIAFLFVCPTIYDVVSDIPNKPSTPSKTTEKIVQDYDYVLQHLRFIVRFTKALWGENPQEDIVNLWDTISEEGVVPLLSADTARIYCNALLMEGLFDKFFIFATNLLADIDSSESYFRDVLLDLMDGQALKRLRSYVKACEKSSNPNEQVARAGRAILLLGHIAQRCKILMEPLRDFIKDAIQSLTSILLNHTVESRIGLPDKIRQMLPDMSSQDMKKIFTRTVESLEA